MSAEGKPLPAAVEPACTGPHSDARDCPVHAPQCEHGRRGCCKNCVDEHHGRVAKLGAELLAAGPQPLTPAEEQWAQGVAGNLGPPAAAGGVLPGPTLCPCPDCGHKAGHAFTSDGELALEYRAERDAALRERDEARAWGSELKRRLQDALRARDGAIAHNVEQAKAHQRSWTAMNSDLLAALQRAETAERERDEAVKLQEETRDLNIQLHAEFSASAALKRAETAEAELEQARRTIANWAPGKTVLYVNEDLADGKCKHAPEDWRECPICCPSL